MTGSDRTPAPGELLIATVGTDDGPFAGAVVLILDHDDSGTLGVILNRYAEPRLESVLPAWKDLVSEPQVLFSGGPVSPTGAICVAALREDVEDPPGFRRLFGRTGLLHLDTPTEIVSGGYAQMRIFAGYAGWSGGQLAGELAADMWWVVPAEQEDVFGDRPEDLWSRVLRRQPGELAFFSTWPEDPEHN